MSKPTNRVERLDRSLRWVRLGDMRVSPVAQREFRPYRVGEMLPKFDPEGMGNPEVNHRHDHDRGGEPCEGYRSGACNVYVKEGQHRIETLKEWLGEGWEDQHVQCWVSEGLTERQEAAEFLRLNDTLTVSALDNFRISIAAGNPVECDIDRQVRHEGLVISKDKMDGHVSCVGTLRRIYMRSDAATLGRAVRIPWKAYGQPGLIAVVIDGVALFVQRYGDDITDEAIIHALASAGGSALGALLNRTEQLYKSTGTGKAHCAAATITEIVNKKRRGRKLPGWWAEA